MSLVTHIDHLVAQPGVLSILVNVPGEVAHRGGHEETLRLALLQCNELNIDRTSTAAGKITIMVQREPGGTAAVAVITGHEIRKSLRRMIRRCAKVKAEPARAVEPPLAVSGEEDPDDDGDIAYSPKRQALRGETAEDAVVLDAFGS